MKFAVKEMKLPLVVAGCFMLTACDKYLDITPKGYTLLNTVSDYSLWLDDKELYTSPSSEYLLLPTDLVDVANPAVPANTIKGMSYAWYPQSVTGTTTPWNDHFKAISSYNSVIVGIDDATGGIEQAKRVIKSEALLGRANEYIYLVNEYGNSYDSVMAVSDLAVPIIVSDDVAQDVPPRSTVKQVYDFIIADLKRAIPDLPADNNHNRFRGSKGAAYALLARAYLYARNYNEAAINAQLAIDNSPYHKLLDLTTMATFNEVPHLSVRQDVIYARGGNSFVNPSLEHLRSFNIYDQRLRFFYAGQGNYTFQTRGAVTYVFGSLVAGAKLDSRGPTIQEMMLIISEHAARNGNYQKALDLLNELRSKRIPAAYFQPYQTTDSQQALDLVLKERELELGFSGLRWFDMRRLNAEGRMPAVNRKDAQGNVIATLEPGSPRYTFQIPLSVLAFNPGMPQNP